MNLDKVKQLTDIVLFVRHVKDSNIVAEEVFGMSDSGRLNGIGKALS